MVAATDTVRAVVDGFVYVSDDSPGPMAGAAVGKRVAKTSLEPPWIVVDQSLDRVLVAKWPGRLFRVAGVAPRTSAERDTLARAGNGLRADAGYTRVLAVDVLEELGPAILFGPHGDAVTKIVDVARSLTEHRAVRLAAACHSRAGEVYHRAWARWLAEQPNGSPYRDGDHSCTLAVPGAGRSGSPIGHGFTVLWAGVRQSAQQRGGTAAITIDADGEEAIAGPWATAARTLLHAAMALGAPELTSAADQAVLTAAWGSVIGDDPLGGTT